ncbi:MAG: Gfo/Idh/MocA family oxidoreductase [Planctomycetaceae bacterium]|nr:Gfo/Idh/MocA family oxidoreductase [Planctomycetaceae bacterium]
MAKAPLRIGVIGAGGNTRLRHIPGLREVDGVEIAGVVNRTPESTQRAAGELGIGRTYADWRALIGDPQIDAVVIGTWPNLHCEATCAALDAGKHVLCEARMARDLAEARRMLAAAKAHPQLVSQIVPSPYGLICGPAIEQLIEEGFLGAVRELVVLGADDQYWDYSIPLHWRQQKELSGNNVLSLGILHETAMRWSPSPTQVFAQTQLFEPERPIPDECRTEAVTVPDSLQVLTQLENGGRGIYHQSGIILGGPGKQIHLYGSRATIKVQFLPSGEERVEICFAGEQEMQPVEIPETQRGRWRVEREFVAAIRGEEQVELTDFATGVSYMEFIEAVHQSAARNQPVKLPLA